MQSKVQSSLKKNPWGWRDENPEKLNQSAPKTVGFRQQLKGLFNPDTMLSQLFGEKRSDQSVSAEKFSIKAPKKEVLLFSFEAKKEEKKLQQETQIVLQKLKEQVTILEKSNKNMVSQMAKVKVEQMPSKTGIYYIRFLEWLLIAVRQLRVRVDEGSAWLNTFMQKKKKRVGYWGMYKKHGTTFGLSHERTLATQTG